VDELTDIVRAAQDGDKDAFGAIVKRFQDMAYGRAYAWLMDHGKAEDAAQDAFVDAYLHLHQLRDSAAFPGWFGRIITKHADRQRRAARPIVQLDDMPHLKSSGPDPFELLYGSEMAEIVKAKVNSLSEDHREAISLFHLKGHSQNEADARLRATVAKGFELANGFRDAGYDVLVKFQGRLVPHADLDTLNRGADDNGSITTYLTSDPPNGLADIPHELDSEIHMSAELANVALYPAVDDEHCRSNLFDDDTFSQANRDTVAEVRRRFYEYRHFNLDSIAKGKGELYLDDGGVTEVRMKRARRIRMFLTQSYHGTEIWTNKMGETVPLANTVATCRRILDGEFDETPLDMWYMAGGSEGILKRIAKQTG